MFANPTILIKTPSFLFLLFLLQFSIADYCYLVLVRFLFLLLRFLLRLLLFLLLFPLLGWRLGLGFLRLLPQLLNVRYFDKFLAQLSTQILTFFNTFLQKVTLNKILPKSKSTSSGCHYIFSMMMP